MTLLWLTVVTLVVLSVGLALGYVAGEGDGYRRGREDRAREEWRDRYGR